MSDDEADKAEQKWQSMLATKMSFGGRGPCTMCGQRNSLDNLMMCPACWNDYCYRCVNEQPLVSAPGKTPRVWQCDCGATLRGMTDAEWLRHLPRGR